MDNSVTVVPFAGSSSSASGNSVKVVLLVLSGASVVVDDGTMSIIFVVTSVDGVCTD